MSDDSRQRFFQSFPMEEFWRFYIDGIKQHEGWAQFETREPGYGACMMSSFFTEMQDEYFTEDLSIESLHRIHANTVDGVKNTNYDSIRLGGQRRADQFRSEIVGFGLTSKNASEFGLEEINVQAGTFGFRIDRKDNKKKLLGTSGEFIEINIQRCLDDYHKEISECDTEGEKLESIIKLISILERIHPYQDANCRTFCMVLLFRECLKHGITPPLMRDPNQFDGHSIQEMKRQVMAGSQRTQTLIEGRPMELPFDKSIPITSTNTPVTHDYDKIMVKACLYEGAIRSGMPRVVQMGVDADNLVSGIVQDGELTPDASNIVEQMIQYGYANAVRAMVVTLAQDHPALATQLASDLKAQANDQNRDNLYRVIGNDDGLGRLFGVNPLHYYASLNTLSDEQISDLATYLSEENIEQVSDLDGKTPLLLCLESDNVDMLKKLLQAGVNMSSSPEVSDEVYRKLTNTALLSYLEQSGVVIADYVKGQIGEHYFSEITSFKSQLFDINHALITVCHSLSPSLKMEDATEVIQNNLSRSNMTEVDVEELIGFIHVLKQHHEDENKLASDLNTYKQICDERRSQILTSKRLLSIFQEHEEKVGELLQLSSSRRMDALTQLGWIQDPTQFESVRSFFDEFAEYLSELEEDSDPTEPYVTITTNKASTSESYEINEWFKTLCVKLNEARLTKVSELKAQLDTLNEGGIDNQQNLAKPESLMDVKDELNELFDMVHQGSSFADAQEFMIRKIPVDDGKEKALFEYLQDSVEFVKETIDGNEPTYISIDEDILSSSDKPLVADIKTMFQEMTNERIREANRRRALARPNR